MQISLNQTQPILLPLNSGRPPQTEQEAAKEEENEIFIPFMKKFWLTVNKESEKKSVSHAVMSNSLRFHGLQPTRLLCPWDFPGRSIEVGCHFLLQKIVFILFMLNWFMVLLSSTISILFYFSLYVCAVFSHSVVSDSLRPHVLQPTRFLCPWDFPGRSIRVGCHCFLHK